MRLSSRALALLLVTSIVAIPSSANAQRRAGEAPSASNAARNTNKFVSAVALNIPCSSLQIERTKPKKGSLGSRIGAMVNEAAVGDRQRVDRAKKVLEANALQAARNPEATFVVLIGTTSDVESVSASLATVERPVIIGFVDKDLEDDNTCNTALSSGLVGQNGLDAATNMWVFLPANENGTRSRPHIGPSAIASETTWNSIFAANGDDSALEQLIRSPRKN